MRYSNTVGSAWLRYPCRNPALTAITCDEVTHVSWEPLAVPFVAEQFHCESCVGAGAGDGTGSADRDAGLQCGRAGVGGEVEESASTAAIPP